MLQTSNRIRTSVHMGASRFTVRSTNGTDQSPLIDLRKANERELSALARTLCELHGISGPRPKPARKRSRPHKPAHPQQFNPMPRRAPLEPVPAMMGAM
jgi:hypothetical protein